MGSGYGFCAFSGILAELSSQLLLGDLSFTYFKNRCHATPYTRLKPGDSGVVWDITTFGLSNEETKQIWIHWDDGGSLALIEGKDELEIIVTESK